MSNSPSTIEKQNTHFPFLDLVRGIAALAVAIDHGTWFQYIPVPSGDLILKATKLSINAPAAVLIFFVISGFCIHLPHRKAPFGHKSFLIRRYVRLGLPLLGASILAYLLGFRWFHMAFGATVIWSLACEAIYYGLYCLIRNWMNLTRWIALFLFSLIMAGIFAYLGRDIIEYPRRPFLDTTLLGLPIWISGVIIAEIHSKSHNKKKILNVILWATILLGGALCTVLKFQWNVSYAVSLSLWGLFIAPWLFMNLRLPSWKITSFLGSISYSLYLVHQPLIIPCRKLGLYLFQNGFARDCFVIFTTIAVAILFYYAVERPGHKLARHLGKRPTT